MNHNKLTILCVIALCISLVALACALAPGITRSNGAGSGGIAAPAQSHNALENMIRTKMLKVGYGGYPPYLKKDVNTGEISGYSVDIIQAILQPLDVKIEWVETTWDTMKQDVLTGKFDLMIEPIFMTIPRSARVGFTAPYAYFGYCAVVVRKGETRFQSIKDLDSKDIRVAVTQGVTDQEYAERNLKNANLTRIPGNDITITLSEVLLGKVDAALADVPTALEFAKAHGDQIDVLFADAPPAISPAGFMTRQEEVQFINFLNSALLYLQIDGTFDALEKKYALPSFREKQEFVVGSGLKAQ